MNAISNPYTYNEKSANGTLSHVEWNEISQATALAQSKINEIINEGVPSSSGEGGSSTPVDTSGVISVSNKGNVTLGSQKNVNIEPAWNNNNASYSGNWGDIALKPGDDIQFASHHREAKKRDKIVVKNIDGSDNPVKLQMVAGEIELAVGTSNNPKTATRKKDKTTGEDMSNSPLFKVDDAKVMDVKILTGNVLDAGQTTERDERGYLKVRAQAIDLRCEKHGGIALQPKGYDSSGNMNKIKFEHGGGDGLEFGTFNSQKTSIFTDEYRFNKDGIWKMSTRQTEPSGKDIIDEGTIPVGKQATGSVKYVKQADDFYDIIDVTDPQCTTKDIIKTSYALNGKLGVHTKITNSGKLEIGTSDQYMITLSGDPEEFGEWTSITPINQNVLDKYLSLGELKEVYNISQEFEESLKAAQDNVVFGVTIDGEYYRLSKIASPDISIDSGGKLKLGGVLDFGSTFNFGETDNGIEVQYKLTKKNATKDCGILKVVGVNNHSSENLVIEGTTIAPGETQTIAQCSILDVVKLVNYMKTNNEGPWAQV